MNATMHPTAEIPSTKFHLLSLTVTALNKLTPTIKKRSSERVVALRLNKVNGSQSYFHRASPLSATFAAALLSASQDRRCSLQTQAIIFEAAAIGTSRCCFASICSLCSSWWLQSWNSPQGANCFFSDSGNEDFSLFSIGILIAASIEF